MKRERTEMSINTNNVTKRKGNDEKETKRKRKTNRTRDSTLPRDLLGSWFDYARIYAR